VIAVVDASICVVVDGDNSVGSFPNVDRRRRLPLSGRGGARATLDRKQTAAVRSSGGLGGWASAFHVHFLNFAVFVETHGDNVVGHVTG
jgi:hypothetical protein